MNDNDILGFEEKIVESFVLENFDDFAARKFLNSYIGNG